MARVSASLESLVAHTARLLSSRRATLWVGEEVSAAAVPSGRRLIRRIARVTLHALAPHIKPLPDLELVVDRLQSFGFELALSLADRTIGRTLPVSLEDPFDTRRPRLPEWETLLTASFQGQPGYLHRALASLAGAGYVGRMVTTNRDDLIEQAARAIGYDLPVIEAIEGDLPPEEAGHPYLLKFHGTSNRPGAWPLDLHRLHMARHSEVMSAFLRWLDQDPLLVLGYLGPDPLDLGPTLPRARLQSLVWADELARTFEVERFDPQGYVGVRSGDGPDRLLQAHGGWRLRGRLGFWLDAVCEALGVQVPGAPWDEEPTTVRSLDDMWWPNGEMPPLPFLLEPIGAALRTRWIGAFALITMLDLWSEETLEGVFARRDALEATLPDVEARAWFRYLLAQTGRSEVEAAFARYFGGIPVPAVDPVGIRRLTRAAHALDLLSELEVPEPAATEELNVESTEVRFALTGSERFLPAASQVIAELPSVTHAERWLRLKAAGALSRRQWSVAMNELGRALAEGGESGSPLMKLRARVGMAGVIGQLLRGADPVPLVSCLNALKRRDRGLAGQTFDAENCWLVASALVLRLYDESLEGYAAALPTLQPPIGPLLDSYLRLALRAYGDDVARYLFDRDPDRGRSYSYLPLVEDQIATRLAETLAAIGGTRNPPPSRNNLTESPGLR